MHRLLAFQKVVELGSFTKAAAALGYTQSAISHMVATLEADFKIKLLYRSRTGVRLTLEGQQLYPFLQRTLRQYQAMSDKAQEINGLGSGTIRIGTISSISAHWLPKLIKAFQERYPRVEFVLLQGDYSSIPEWVRTGEVDFGFVTPDALTNTPVTFLKSGRLLAILPPHHRLVDQSTVSLADLASEPFLALEEGAYSEPLTAFAEQGLHPRIKMRVHDDYSILSMVELGMGVSILPELVLSKTAHDVVTRPLKPNLTRKIGIVSQDAAALPIASKTFIDFILTHVAELP
ncbi:LysR family transcriptional regulator [Levilactobacillus yonginensis]|uniref:LysR family transcriptional regulator n=1 Tax=Levilactobacillus yonginensis TaxID=1054041 RepID=UPI000F776FE2|nr:LysR family transcriptional regulator [Levilactobacillus yonginensis]